jgi:hypothetical protein
MYHYTDGDLSNFWLANGYERSETLYGMAIAIRDLPGLSRAICDVLTRKNSNLTDAESRYLRQAMLLLQPTLEAIAAYSDGNEQVKNIIHAMNDVERTIHFVMTETKHGWEAKVSEVDLSEHEDCEEVT